MDRKHRFFVWLSAIFVAALVTSDLIGAKFFRVWGLDLSVGMIPFPLTFLAILPLLSVLSLTLLLPSCPSPRSGRGK